MPYCITTDKIKRKHINTTGYGSYGKCLLFKTTLKTLSIEFKKIDTSQNKFTQTSLVRSYAKNEHIEETTISISESDIPYQIGRRISFSLSDVVNLSSPTNTPCFLPSGAE